MSASLGYAAYARRHSVSRQAIHQAARRGLLALAGGRVDPALADETWLARRREREAFQRARRALRRRGERAEWTTTIAKLSVTRREVERLRGRLIDRDEATRALLALLDRLAEGLRRMACETDPIIVEIGRLGLAEFAGIEAEALRVTGVE